LARQKSFDKTRFDLKSILRVETADKTPRIRISGNTKYARKSGFIGYSLGLSRACIVQSLKGRLVVIKFGG